MLRDNRKLFTISSFYDENFKFPGSTLPGPEAPRLTEPKTVDDRSYSIGDFDPEWIPPDIENIALGEYDGRYYYSIRDDLPTDAVSLGNPDEKVDPQVLSSVSQELYDAIKDMPSFTQVKRNEGIANSAEESFSYEYPTLADLQKALKTDPNIVEDFNSAYDEKVTNLLTKLGIVLQS